MDIRTIIKENEGITFVEATCKHLPRYQLKSVADLIAASNTIGYEYIEESIDESISNIILNILKDVAKNSPKAEITAFCASQRDLLYKWFKNNLGLKKTIKVLYLYSLTTESYFKENVEITLTKEEADAANAFIKNTLREWKNEQKKIEERRETDIRNTLDRYAKDYMSVCVGANNTVAAKQNVIQQCIAELRNRFGIDGRINPAYSKVNIEAEFVKYYNTKVNNK